MKKILGIAVALVLVISLTAGSASSAAASRTTIYVENADDDALWIKFYLDGALMKSVMTYQKTSRYLGYYSLDEGPHELKIEWKDPDTCEWQEKTETITASGEDITATLAVVPNVEPSCVVAAPAAKTKSYGTLAVSVKNNDDDNVFTMLFINEERRKERTTAPNSTIEFLKVHALEPGNYTVKIRWKEPDTKEWFEKTKEIILSEGENNVTMEIDELIYTHVFAQPNSAIDISVENVDDDDLWVDIYLDSSFASKYIKSGTKRHIKTFDGLYEGKHTVRMRWIDPDVRGWQEKGFIIYVESDEEVSRTFHTVKNTR